MYKNLQGKKKLITNTVNRKPHFPKYLKTWYCNLIMFTSLNFPPSNNHVHARAHNFLFEFIASLLIVSHAYMHICIYIYIHTYMFLNITYEVHIMFLACVLKSLTLNNHSACSSPGRAPHQPPGLLRHLKHWTFDNTHGAYKNW